MKRTAITGLFLSAALLASPVFAAEDLCAINLQQIEDNMATAVATPEDQTKSYTDDVSKAKAAQAAGDDKTCIEITEQVKSAQQKANKGDSGAGS